MKVLTLGILMLLIVVGVFVGGYMFSITTQTNLDVSLSEDPSNTFQMWQIYIPSVSAVGDNFVGYVEAGTADGGMEITKTLRIEVSPLGAYSTHNQTHHQKAVTTWYYQHGVWLAHEQAYIGYSTEDVYTYDSGWLTIQYDLKIYAGDELVADRIIAWDYRKADWVTIDLPTYADDVYVQHHTFTNAGLLVSVGNVQYFEVDDRNGTEHGFLTYEGALDSLVDAWGIWSSATEEQRCSAGGSCIIGGSIGGTGMLGDSITYPEFVPIVTDYLLKYDYSDTWTMLEWGDTQNLLGAVRYYEDNAEMYRAYQSIPCLGEDSWDIDTARGNIILDYNVGCGISHSMSIFIPLDVADTIVWEAASCDASPTINSVTIDNPVTDEGDKSIMSVSITNNGLQECIFDVNVDGIHAFRLDSPSFQPGETKSIRFEVFSPDLALEDDACVDKTITVQAMCGMGCASNIVTVVLTICESSPEEGGAGGEGTGTVLLFGVDVPVWLVLLVLAIFFGLLIWWGLGGRRRRV